MSESTIQHLSDLLKTHLDTRGSDVLVRFLPTHEHETIETWTYTQLHQHATTLAATLSTQTQVGERALIMTSRPQDFLISLFGCWYAGLVAVPVYPPNKVRRSSSLTRLQSILKDCDASCLIMPRDLNTWMHNVHDTPHIILEEALSKDTQFTPHDKLKPQDIALLQYTSGSTGNPKGVILTHANVLANLKLFAEIAPLQPGETVVNWMPLFHDLGLSLFLYAPFVGSSITLLTPEGFLRRPARWLEAISTYKAAFSGAPNFAYELCHRRISSEDMHHVDLSGWRYAMNAAEPVRAQTIDDFCKKFAPQHFSHDAMMPSYGLAEATAFGSAGRSGELPILHLDTTQLQNNIIEISNTYNESIEKNTQAFVGCGKTYLDSDVRIIHTSTNRICNDLELGEICLTGPQIGQGYWGQSELSSEVFGLRVDGDERPFLRTGDLGFLHDGELFVTGRLKDLIIVHGRNHYPQDIELSVEQSTPLIRPGCVAAFTRNTSSSKHDLVAIAELRKPTDHTTYADLAETIQHTILTHHGLSLHTLVFVPPRTLHKTSSGKIQRRACRQSLGEHAFEPYFTMTWDAQQNHPTHSEKPTKPLKTNDLQWFSHKIAALVNVSPEHIDVTTTFSELGLTSVTLVELLPLLEERFMCRLTPQIFFEYPTPMALLDHVLSTSQPTQSEFSAPASSHAEPVAIIGAACRLPGDIHNLESLWSFLLSQQDAITTVPPERWTTFDDGVSPYGAFLQNIDAFDASFFGVSGQEASQMDPQQRLLLEVVWEAIEHAGLSTHDLDGSQTGVFAGMSASTYANLRTANDKLDSYTGTSTLDAAAAGRIAYTFNLKGPALVLDTACSSSLVALHTACQSIHTGDSELAIACGVNLVLSPEGHIYLSHIGAMASDGRCKTFDAQADGYVRGEGCVALMLKRLSKAREDGDRILGVVQGSAINHDGRTNGLTAPSVQAQQSCYQRALERAQIPPSNISYIETHGTGTHLGDPIELQGLNSVYGACKKDSSHLHIGAVKSQLGHGEAVAGLTGVLKILCMFEHQTIPAQANFHSPNPLINWDDTPFEVPRHTLNWTASASGKRHAAVSSFGISGTNAHIILSHDEKFNVSATAHATTSQAPYILPLSARHTEALSAFAQRHADMLEQSSAPLSDIMFSAARRRTHHHLRTCLVAHTRDELTRLLRNIDTSSLQESRAPRVVFVFPGHGSQWAAMGQSLWHIPLCKEVFQRCERAFASHVDWSLKEHLLSPDACPHWSRIDRVQPMIFAVQMALATLWKSWKIQPDAVIGHSMGEVAAMCQAGTLSLEDAACIICTRSKLMLNIEGQGEMAVVGISYEEAERWLLPWSDELAIGVHNSPQAVVFSGSPTAVQAMVDRAERESIFARKVKIKLASHSPQTEVLRDDLLDGLAHIRPKTSTIPVFSTVNAAYIEDTSSCTAQYWFRNLREPVRFASSLRSLAEEQTAVFIEISPHPVLCSAMSGMFKQGRLKSSCVPSMRRDQDAKDVLFQSLAHLYGQGCNPEWSRIIQEGALTTLPSYPFQRKRYWLNSAPSTPTPTLHNAHNLLGDMQQSVLNPDHYLWPAYIDLAHKPWLKGHTVKHAVILPATYYITLAIEAATQVFGQPPMELGDIVFSTPLFVQEHQSHTIQVEARRMNDGLLSFHIASRQHHNEPWQIHAHGLARKTTSSRANLYRAQDHTPTPTIEASSLYTYFDALGLNYRDTFQRLERAHITHAHTHALVAHQEHHNLNMPLHPATVDACLQALGLAQLAELPEQGVCIPVHIGRMVLFQPLEQKLHVHAQSHGDTGDILVRSHTGELLLCIEHVAGHPLDPLHASKPLPQAPWISSATDEFLGIQETWCPLQLPTSQPHMGHRWLIISGDDSEDIHDLMRHLGEHSRHVHCMDTHAVKEALSQSFTHVLLIPTTTGDEAPSAVLECSNLLHHIGQHESALTVWILTQRGRVIPSHHTDTIQLSHASLWGLSHAFELEYPHVTCKRLDVDTLDAQALVPTLLCDTNHTRLALRQNKLFFAHLENTNTGQKSIINKPLNIKDTGTYIISGGHGTFGFQIARELAHQGARSIALLSRQGAHNAHRRARLAQLHDLDVQIVDIHVDVSDKSALEDALKRITQPVRGIFHTAGVLDDQMISQLSHDAVERTFGAKVRGALNLHLATTSMPELEHFVLCSSATSTIGAPGQGAYAAANASLDVLAQWRHQHNLPAHSIRWCPIADEGMANQEQVQRLAHRGVSSLNADEITPVLTSLIQRKEPVHMPLTLNMKRFQQFYPHVSESPFYAKLWEEETLKLTRDERFLARLKSLPASSRIDVLERFLQEQIAQLLSMDVDHISRTRSVQELGFDSLVTLELRNQLETVLGISLTSSFVWRHPSVEQLAVALLDELGELHDQQAPLSLLNKSKNEDNNILESISYEYFKNHSDDDILNALLHELDTDI